MGVVDDAGARAPGVSGQQPGAGVAAVLTARIATCSRLADRWVM
jgi:hypothetical protein